MRRRTHDPLVYPRGIYVLGLACGALFVGLFVFATRSSVGTSVEVTFTDRSASGMQIMPASCASPPPLTADSRGYRLLVGSTDAGINNYGYYFCVSNSRDVRYFLPANTGAEIQAFLNAVPGLPGVSQRVGPDNP